MPSDRRRLVLLLAAALSIRLVVFPINENLYGDAVSRTELSEAWARSPHYISSFGDGAAQYGPLHLYLIGGALSVFDRNDAARVVSLLFGVLTLIPLFGLTRHYFGSSSATWAVLAVAVWGLHIQASTTGGSEAVGLFLMWVALAWLGRGLYRPHWLPFTVAAAAMNLAAATRYDAWMYVPLLAAAPVLQWTDRRRAVRYGLLFVLLCLPWPVTWLAGNALAHGDPLYPLTYIDEFHRLWALDAGEGWGAWWLRLQGIGFWPAMAIVTLSPGVALLGLFGMVWSWRARPATRWLIVAAGVPTAYYGLRTAVLRDFVPLARFTIVQVSLLLPFVVSGWVWVASQRGTRTARHLALATVAMAIGWPLALGWYTFRNDSPAATILMPVSPTSTNPAATMAAATFVRSHVVASGRTLALDEDATYQDIQVAFFGRADPRTTLRMRWPRFRDRMLSSPPDVVVMFERGRLRHEPWIGLDATTLRIGEATYQKRPDFTGAVSVFEKRLPPPAP